MREHFATPTSVNLGGPSPTKLERNMGAELQRQRLNKGLSVLQLATSLGIAPGLLLEYESGSRRIEADHLHGLAVELDVRISTFFVGTGS